MMFKTIKVLFLTFILYFMVAATPSWATGKIAVFNAKEAILKSNTAQSRLKILRNSAAYQAKKKRFESLQKEGKALVDKVSKDADVLSLDRKEQIRKNLKGKEGELAKLAEEIQKEEIKIQQQLLKEITPRLERAVKQVVKAQGIGLLLEKQSVVHADATYDVTEAVIKRLNQ